MNKKKLMVALGYVAAFIVLVVVWFYVPYSPLKADFEKDAKELEDRKSVV